MRIACVGFTCLDRIALVPQFPSSDMKIRTTNNELIEKGGGNAANNVHVLLKLCDRTDTVQLISKVGDDDMGERLVGEFIDDTRFVDTVVVGKGSSPSTFIIVAPNSRTCIHTTGTTPPLHSDEIEVEILEDAAHVHFDSRQTAAALFCANNVNSEATLSIDCEKVRLHENSSDAFWNLTAKCCFVFTNKTFPFIFERNVLNLSDEDIVDMDTSDYVRAHELMLASEKFEKAQFIVSTRGSDSIIVSERGEESFCVDVVNSVSEDEAVDSTGCGDVFISAFLYIHKVRAANGVSLKNAVELASLAATSKLKSAGARGDIISKTEFDILILERSEKG